MWGKARFPEVPEFKRKPFSFFSRALYRLLSVYFEYPLIEEMFKVKRMLKKEEGYDLLISFAVPYVIHFGVAWSRSEKHPVAGMWIADCGDPFMGNVIDTFKKPFYFAYFEKWFSRKADYIVIPIDSAIDGYYPEFHNKFRVIPQGFDFRINTDEVPLPKNDIPTFSYAGGFLKGVRDPGQLLEFLSKQDRPFRFIVYTNSPELLIPFQEKLGDKLEIHGFIPRDELLSRLSEMDFLVNLDNNTARNSPSKLIDYAIVNRPILNLTRDFDPVATTAFLDGDYQQKMLLPDLEKYHISNVSRSFLELLNNGNPD